MSHQTMSATAARVRFGEVMQRVVKQNEPVIVERAGQPQVVILSVAAYQHLQANQAPPPNWQSLVARSRQQIAAELKGAALPPADEIIHQVREARNAEYADLR